jgi:hypothetical protein
MAVTAENRADHWWSCARKHAYETEESARASAEMRGADLTVYRCRYARHFHIANPPRKWTKRRPRKRE